MQSAASAIGAAGSAVLRAARRRAAWRAASRDPARALSQSSLPRSVGPLRRRARSARSGASAAVHSPRLGGAWLYCEDGAAISSDRQHDAERSREAHWRPPPARAPGTPLLSAGPRRQVKWRPSPAPRDLPSGRDAAERLGGPVGERHAREHRVHGRCSGGRRPCPRRRGCRGRGSGPTRRRRPARGSPCMRVVQKAWFAAGSRSRWRRQLAARAARAASPGERSSSGRPCTPGRTLLRAGRRRRSRRAPPSARPRIVHVVRDGSCQVSSGSSEPRAPRAHACRASGGTLAIASHDRASAAAPRAAASARGPAPGRRTASTAGGAQSVSSLKPSRRKCEALVALRRAELRVARAPGRRPSPRRRDGTGGCAPTWPERFARSPLCWSSTRRRHAAGREHDRLRVDRARGGRAAPLKGATTRPATPVHAPSRSARTCSHPHAR